MFVTKPKVTGIVLLVLAVASGGAGVVTYQKLVAQAPSQKEASAPKILAPAEQTPEAIQKEAERLLNLATALVTPEEKLKAILDKARGGEKLKSLLWARFDAANAEVKVRWKEFCGFARRKFSVLPYPNISTYLQPIYSSSWRLLEAQLDLSNLRALTQHLGSSGRISSLKRSRVSSSCRGRSVAVAQPALYEPRPSGRQTAP